MKPASRHGYCYFLLKVSLREVFFFFFVGWFCYFILIPQTDACIPVGFFPLHTVFRQLLPLHLVDSSLMLRVVKPSSIPLDKSVRQVVILVVSKEFMCFNMD